MHSLRFVSITLCLTIFACKLPFANSQSSGSTPATAPQLLPATIIPTSIQSTEVVEPPLMRSEEVIQILSPGPHSSVTSPVSITGLADPTFEQNLVISITGEEGNTLAVQPTTIQAEIGQRGPFETQVEFVVAIDQPGRISVFDIDARDGSLVHLSSVDVTLLASGAASIEPPRLDAEVIEIYSPALQAEVSGGTLIVEGFSEFFFESSLGIVICAGGAESGEPDPLCGNANNVIARGFALIETPDFGLPGPFRGEAAYSIAEPTLARVIVYADSPRDGGLLHGSSTLVTLLP